MKSTISRARSRTTISVVSEVQGMVKPMQACNVHQFKAIKMTGYHSHRSATHGRRVTHDDTFRDSSNTVVFAKGRCIEQMISRLLEGRQHQNAVLHLGYSEACDTQHLSLKLPSVKKFIPQMYEAYLVGHDIAKQHDMTRIDDHVMRFHGILDLIDDRSPRGLDS